MNDILKTGFRVVVNQHGQHSIWPLDRPLPSGWRGVSVIGTREECLNEIEKLWPDPSVRVG
jgi:MbtH protein